MSKCDSGHYWGRSLFPNWKLIIIFENPIQFSFDFRRNRRRGRRNPACLRGTETSPRANPRSNNPRKISPRAWRIYPNSLPLSCSVQANSKTQASLPRYSMVDRTKWGLRFNSMTLYLVYLCLQNPNKYPMGSKMWWVNPHLCVLTFCKHW
jgi:hypothetical protein